MRLRPDGVLEVRLTNRRRSERVDDIVEEFPLSADERKELADLLKRVGFFDSPQVAERGGGLGEARLRASLDGRERERLLFNDPTLVPLSRWFGGWTSTARLLGTLRRTGDAAAVLRAVEPREDSYARRDRFRAPLRELAATTSDPARLARALGALAALEEPAPWGAFASGRIAELGAEARLRALGDLVMPEHWWRGLVSDAHRATLRPDAFRAARDRLLAMGDLPRQKWESPERLIAHLARLQFEPVFESIPELARANLDDESSRVLRLTAFWGERGLEAVLALTADAEPRMRRAAVRALGEFLYEGADKPRYVDADHPRADHPLPPEERARVRERLLGEGLARLDAMGEDAAEGREGRYFVRREADGLRFRSRPKPREPVPAELTLEVRGQDRKSRPGVRAMAIPVAAAGKPDDTGRETLVRETGADGVARFGVLAPGEWEFDVDDPVLRKCWRTATRIDERGGPVGTIQVCLIVRERRPFSGRLVGNSGRPLAGAAVCRVGADGAPLADEVEQVVDESGRVTIPDVPPGTEGRARVRLADGRTFLLEERFLSGEEEWLVDFGPEGDGAEAPVVTGRVAGPDGIGLSASIEVFAAGTDAPVVHRWASRPDGSFELYGLAPGAYRLKATHLDPQRRSFAGSPTGWAEVERLPAAGVTVAIRLGGRISGRVVDEKGAPLAGHWIVAERREPAGAPAPTAGPGAAPPLGAKSRGTITDAEGRFLLEDLQEGDYAISPSPGLPIWFVPSAPARTGATDLVVRAMRAVPIRGSVATKDGVALRWIEVVGVRLPGRDHRCLARTWPSGEFSLEGADPASDYELVVRLDGGAIASAPAVSRAGGDPARLEADPGPLGTVAVRDRFGDPWPGFRLRLVHETTRRAVEVLCDEGGVAHLPYGSTGRWRVERGIEAPGREKVLGTVESGVAGQSVSVPEEMR